MADNVDKLLNCHARSTRVSFCHAIWLVNEKTKVVTSQKSFSGSGSQTLFSAEPVTEKIRLRSQAKPALAASLSTDLLQLFLGRPCFLFPCGFHLSACLVTLLFGFLRVCFLGVRRGGRPRGFLSAFTTVRHSSLQGDVLLTQDRCDFVPASYGFCNRCSFRATSQLTILKILNFYAVGRFSMDQGKFCAHWFGFAVYCKWVPAYTSIPFVRQGQGGAKKLPDFFFNFSKESHRAKSEVISILCLWKDAFLINYKFYPQATLNLLCFKMNLHRHQLFHISTREEFIMNWKNNTTNGLRVFLFVFNEPIMRWIMQTLLIAG